MVGDTPSKIFINQRFQLLLCFEFIKIDTEPLLQIRNKDVIDKIRKGDDDTMREVESIITKWKAEHGLD